MPLPWVVASTHSLRHAPCARAHRPRILQVLLSLLLLLLLQTRSAHAKVVQIQVLHRHGARPPLKKHPFNQTEAESSSGLFPQGSAQLRELGRYLRKTYIEDGAPKQIDGINPERPGRDGLISYSSNFRRTLTSGAFFLRGLYPGPGITAQLVFGNEENDWIIRGYAICEALAKKFKEFVESDEFVDKKREGGNDVFVKELAEKLKDQPGTFDEVYNIYDRFQILNNSKYGSDNYEDKITGAPLTVPEMERLKGLADWYETSKYHFAEHNIHVGTGLVQEIMKRMRAIIPGPPEIPSHRIVHYSVHYPTLLSLWSSLRAGNPEEKATSPADKIPGYGAALVFELHEIEGKFVVRMQWFQGDLLPLATTSEGTGGNRQDREFPEPVFSGVAIGRAGCTDKEKGCDFEMFSREVATADLGRAKFCQICKATTAVCGTRQVQGPESQTGGQQSGGGGVGGKVTAGVIGGVIGLVGGLGMALVYMTCTARRKRHGMRYQTGSFDGDRGEMPVLP